LKVLVACEFSGTVREAFRKKGHDAWSCDLIPSDAKGHHYQGDVLELLGKDWDLMIAFPPCTYITTTANRHFKNNPERWKKRYEAMIFVWKLLSAPIERIALENPKGVITSHIRKADQYIHPYQFGDAYEKMTGLWLKNLPLLEPTNIVTPEYTYYNSKKNKSGKSRYSKYWKLGKDHGRERSITPKGIANAMAAQWG